MHYYSFNIGDYVGDTQHLELLEDLAYRRMLDLYYSKESPLPESVDEIARLIRMRPHKDCIAVVLNDFFELVDGFWHCQKADKEIAKYRDKSEKAKQSAKKRWNQESQDGDSKEKDSDGNANASKTHNEGNANHKPRTNNHKPNIKDLFDAERIIPIWNSLGCQQHKGLTQKACKAIEKTYGQYCKQSKSPHELNDWLESYLLNGFANWMTNHHRQMNDGQWAADLEFAVRLDTYDKVKNTVVA